MSIFSTAIRKLSSPASPRQIFHGKLNLEQQKKRAKELLRGCHHQQVDSLTRFNNTHPRAESVQDNEIKLTHCQLVIARENGFSSWQVMKAHIESLSIDQRQLDDQQTLHIRCGSDIKHSLELAGFTGCFLEFSDPFCQGPVKDLPLDQLVELRSQFTAGAYELAPADAKSRMRMAYDGLAQVGQWQRVVLWFEHDSYDQLILAFLLAYFFRHPFKGKLEMICVDQVPGVSDFIGLGQLSPELLRYLWDNERKPVSTDQLVLGEKVWKALCADSSVALQELVQHGTASIPMMAVALQRHLEELPDSMTGLSLTESLILQCLSEDDSLTVGKLFHRYMTEREPLVWLGDVMFWSIVQQLASAIEPLVDINQQSDMWHKFDIKITATGLEVLAGRRHFDQFRAQDRWVGGVLVPAATYEGI